MTDLQGWPTNQADGAAEVRFHGVLARGGLPSNSRYRERITPTRSVKVKKPLLMKRPMDEKGWIRQWANAKGCVVRKAAPPRG